MGQPRRYLGKICKKHPDLKGLRQPSGSCVGCNRARVLMWQTLNPVRHTRKTTRSNARVKKLVINGYGGRCVWPKCGLTDIDMLTIDHIRGGGSQHRLEAGTGLGIYRDLIRRKFPKGHRVLCANHNLKAHINKIRRERRE